MADDDDYHELRGPVVIAIFIGVFFLLTVVGWVVTIGWVVFECDESDALRCNWVECSCTKSDRTMELHYVAYHQSQYRCLYGDGNYSEILQELPSEVDCDTLERNDRISAP